MADINELISKQALADLERLEKSIDRIALGLYEIFDAAKASNEALSQMKSSDTGKLAQEQKKAADSAKKLSAEEEKLLKVEKERTAAKAALDKQRQAALTAMAKEEAKARELAAAIAKEATTVNELRKQNAALRKVRDEVNLSTENAAEIIAEYNRKIDENDKQISSAMDSLSKQRLEIGRYKENVKAALHESGLFGKQMGLLGRAQEIAAAGTKLLKLGFMTLRGAIISTGIGALIVAIGMLISYFTSTEEGAIKLQKVLNALRVTFKNIKDIVNAAGGAIVSFFSGDTEKAASKLNEAWRETKTIVSDVNRELGIANDILDKKEELEDIEIGNIKVIADLERDVAKLRLKSTELKYKDQKAALAAVDEAINKENAIMILRENAAKRSYEIAKNELSIVNASAAEYDEKRRAEAEAYASLQAIQEENAQNLKKLYKERNVFIKEQEEEAKKIRDEAWKDYTEIIKNTTAAVNATEKEMLDVLEDITDDIIAEGDREMEAYLNREEKKQKAAEDTAKKRLEGEKLVNQAAVDLGKETINALFTLGQYQTQREINNFNEQLAAKEISQEEYDKKVRELNLKQAKRDKAQAIFNATISTAEAVVKAYASAVAPLNFILAALVGAAGAVQIGLIAAQPLPAYAKGTASSGEGFARVAEQGRELIVDPSGAMSITGDKEEVRYLKKGTRVIPNRETESILANAQERSGRGSDTHIVERLNALRSITIYPEKGRITDRRGEFYKRTYLNNKLR